MSSVTLSPSGTLGFDILIRQNDTAPAVSATLLDNVGNPLNLTGATVKFNMRNQLTKVAVISLGSVTIVNATAGQVSYVWQAADTLNNGNFEAEFLVTFADATKETVPNNKFLLVSITPTI
jgi:hypothetical protein